MPEQTDVFPLTDPGTEGTAEAETVSVRIADVPQLLAPVTDTVPPVPFGVTTILLPVLVPVQPVGNDQLYVVTLGSAVTAYVWLTPEQTDALPEMDEGCTGGIVEKTVVV